MTAATDGFLPKDAAGYPSEGVYAPNVGTVAAQAGPVLVDSTGQAYAPQVVITSSASATWR